MIPSNVPHSQL